MYQRFFYPCNVTGEILISEYRSNYEPSSLWIFDDINKSTYCWEYVDDAKGIPVEDRGKDLESTYDDESHKYACDFAFIFPIALAVASSEINVSEDAFFGEDVPTEHFNALRYCLMHTDRQELRYKGKPGAAREFIVNSNNYHVYAWSEFVMNESRDSVFNLV